MRQSERPLPILIISLSRSGGKLVRTLLDGHAQVRALPFEHWQSESKFKIRDVVVKRFSLLDPADKLNACGGAHAERKIKALNGADTATATMRGWMQAAEGAGRPADLFPALADCYFAQIGQADSGGKATVNHSGSLCLFSPAQIETLFGPARHVLTMRDPRAVWTSEHGRRADRYTPDRLQRGLITAAEYNAHLEMSARDNGGSRYLRGFCENYRTMLEKHAGREDVVAFRFEDLVQSPERVMRELAERLGLAWDPRLLEPTQLGEPRRANSSFGRGHGIDASAARDWTARIAPEDREFIERSLSDIIAFTGSTWDIASAPGRLAIPATGD